MTNKFKNIFISIFFVIFIEGVFIINIVTKDNEISYSERRKLQQFPNITFNSLFNGTFSDNFDKYTMDQFISREGFRKIKIKLELLLKENYNNIYENEDYLIEQLYPLKEKSVQNLIDHVKQIKDLYLDNNNIYFTVIPDKNYFINNGNLRIDYDNLKNTIIKELPFANHIDIFDLLELSDYYKTDIHWKQENIIDVATRIMETMNVEYNINYEKIYITDFKGVYSNQIPIQKNTDKINILTNSSIQNSIVYNYENKKTSSVYNMDKKNSNDKYDIFLSGAVSLISIENENAFTNKELIVFRDSFASSLIPLMINSYSKIILVDTRYISPKILNNYIDFSDKDILFIYSTTIINNSSIFKE